jgi:hypothetical protein
MALRRGLAALAMAAFVAAMVVVGCGNGLSASDADLRCGQEQTSKVFCYDTNVYNSCVSCFERCGNDCLPQGDCPEQYLCPGDTPLDAGSDAL